MRSVYSFLFYNIATSAQIKEKLCICHYQIKDINKLSMIFEPNLIPRACFSLVSTKNTASGQIQSRNSANHGLPAHLRRLRNLKQ